MARSSGNVHAQPLYIEGGPNGPMIIAVTASNNVYALNATTGAVDLAAHRYWSALLLGSTRAEMLIPLAPLARRLSISLPEDFSSMH